MDLDNNELQKIEQNKIEIRKIEVRKTEIRKTDSHGIDFEKKSNLISFILYVLTVVVIGFLTYYNNFDKNSIFKIEIIGIIYVTIILFYLKIEKKEYSIDKYYALAIGYIISSLLLMLFNYYELYNLIIIGPMLIAVIVDANIGILTNIYIVLITYLVWGVNLENAIYYLTFVTLACIISKYLKNNKLVPYIFIIMISVHVILSLVLNSFKYDREFSANLILSVASTIIALIVVYSLYYVYNRFIIAKEKSINYATNEVQAVQGQHIESVELIESVETDKPIETIDEQQVVKEPILLDKLKELSVDLYDHSHQVADMCFRAAELIGADTEIARDGGLYHEIGRINGSDYINEGVKLATQYNLQEDVIDIIKQYSGAYDIPQTKEAAIVLLTESVVSTMDYVKSRTDKKAASPDKIIEQVFIAKIKKNLFDESGMELDDYKLLRKFYVNEYSKGVNI